MTVATSSPLLAITMGDPAGIGPEIIAKAFRDHSALLQDCFVVGDVSIMRRAARFIGGEGLADLPVLHLDVPDDARGSPPRCIPVLQISEQSIEIPVGQVSGLAGKMAGECVQWAARAALAGRVGGLVTAPLHKESLAAAGEAFHAFPGHTELLQAEAARHQGCPVSALPVRMMLASDELRTVLHSIHLSLREAIARVDRAALLETFTITDAALSALLGRRPHIGVAGLNPHAGENGLFGQEELAHIAPAIADARAQGMHIQGPIAPDTVFMRARHTAKHPGEFDVVVAMYHDQGLIPIKYHGVEQGVNVTLGLPLVRTSPDHGTAFDIAGTGRADASSLIEAVKLARRLVQQRH